MTEKSELQENSLARLFHAFITVIFRRAGSSAAPPLAQRFKLMPTSKALEGWAPSVLSLDFT